MILDNDYKTSVLKKQSPAISVTEAIHGTYNSNFILKKKDNPNDGLPLGRINDSEEAHRAIMAKKNSINSIQYIDDESRLSHTQTLKIENLRTG